MGVVNVSACVHARVDEHACTRKHAGVTAKRWQRSCVQRSYRDSEVPVERNYANPTAAASAVTSRRRVNSKEFGDCCVAAQRQQQHQVVARRPIPPRGARACSVQKQSEWSSFKASSTSPLGFEASSPSTLRHFPLRCRRGSGRREPDQCVQQKPDNQGDKSHRNRGDLIPDKPTTATAKAAGAAWLQK
jgi:hypothetical protein